MYVRLGYETDGGTTRRVLADSAGRVWVPGEGWRRPRGAVTTAQPRRYTSWSDVRFAWAGGCPYWHAATVVH